MRGGLEALDDSRVRLSAPDLAAGILGTAAAAAIVALHVLL